MKKSNYLLIAAKFVRKKYPFQVTHFVTAKCNARCKHCFYWPELNQKKNELTLEEIKKITKTMPRFPALIFSGGEPFLRNDLADIAKAYYDNNKIGRLSIPTNGSLPDKTYHTVKKILDSCPNHILTVGISLDGLGEDHDKSRGVPGIFNKLEKTYAKLYELKQKYKNFNVNFLTTVTKLNQNKLTEINDYGKKHNADVTMIMIRGNPKEPAVKEIDLKNYEAIYELQNDKFKDPNAFSHTKLKLRIRKRIHEMEHEFISKTNSESRYFIPCYAGKLDAVFSEAGDVYSCELLKMKLGNIRDYNYDFKKLWNCQEAEKIRKFINDTKCFCTHECVVRTNILFNPKIMLKRKL